MLSELKTKLGAALTRRWFLKGMGAAGATAALANCGSGAGAKTLFAERGAPSIPAVTGTIVPGSAAHNCGGRCQTKAYVENGVVKRLVTDERPDLNINDGTGDDPQRRACPRCRAHKGFMYRADRLLHPLKQMGVRGDVNGFVQITWDQAFTEIAQQLTSIIATYGNTALYSHYMSGDGASVPRAGGSGAGSIAQRLCNLLGGFTLYRNDYSYPALEHTSLFVLGTDMGSPSTSSTQDVLNADQIILWSNNCSEMIANTGTGWYLMQAKEKGIPITSIEDRISQTTATFATSQIGIVTGTDAALILAMMYHLIKQDLLDASFIKTYVHGFYDDPTPTHYHSDVQATGKYVVPAGTSLSAFVLGNDNALVTRGLNQGTSVYPYDIGYNVNSDDPLYGKRVPIWGQSPKTPEWAEKITGVPAAIIRSLAESIAAKNKKTTIWMGGGWNRHCESEQALMLCYILGAITQNWGLSGRMFGQPSGKTSAGGLNMTVIPNGVSIQSKVYDLTKLTSATYTTTQARNTFPVFLWPDLVKNGGTGKSDWNDGQIKQMGPVKALINFAGNTLVNQTGHTEYTKAILRDRTKLQLIVVTDLYMTASAAFGDYVLPAAAAFERVAATTTTEGLLYMGKAVEPPGECKDDYDIATGIADKLGIKDKFTEGKSQEDWVQYAWNQNNITSMTYDQWKAAGIYTSNNPNAPQVVKWDKFRSLPATNPLKTPSGKFEAYTQALVEDYLARKYNNVDAAGLPLTGPLHDGSTAARFLYPIPMYIPQIEGRHANESLTTGPVEITGTGGIPHPDPLGLRSKGYTVMLHTFHIMYRSHSTHNSNAFLNELFKKDAKGNPAFMHPKNRTTLAVWDDGVYEPVWINPQTAQAFGIAHGDRVLISNDRGRMYASANVTQRAQPNIINIGEGAWHQLNAAGIDVGGCANTVMSARPSRICQGMTLGSGTLVKIEKA
jgi:anaerobic dimethyl sulfoxide reductase subunit A